MLEVTDILAAGFKEFPVDRFSKLRYVDRNWQKTYWSNDDKKKLYFVTVEQWDYTKYPNSPQGYGYQASGYFARVNQDRKDTFTVDLLYPEFIPQIEAFFCDVFVRMGCKAADD